MQQVLFDIPFLKGWWVIPADGIPVSGFGAMLFVTFIVCTMWATRRGKTAGLAAEKTQDMVLWIFIAGLIGARTLYMIQYSHQFPNKDIVSLVVAFAQIWKGGIIFYGSALGGVIGYALFYKYVLKKLNVSGWRLADAMAPVLALGLAIGRIGCYLNGCCWGQVAIDEVAPVPLGAAHYPLLAAHCRDDMVRGFGLQSSTGFTISPRDFGQPANDPRSVVRFVEKNSAADRAGLKPGDRVVRVNGLPNAAYLQLDGSGEALSRAWDELRKQPGAKEAPTPEYAASFDDVKDFERAALSLDRAGVRFVSSDRLAELVRDWPRGRHDVEIGVLRDGNEVSLPPFSPRSVGLYPTQLYETLSMVLLILLLVAYYPFRRHDGQLMVLCMMCYSVHRFIDESLRIEPAIGLGLTLSQWGSVVIFSAATGIEIFLRRTMPSRWAHPQPIV